MDKIIKPAAKARRFTKKKLIVFGVVLLVLAAFCIVNNKWLTITEYTFSDSRIKNGFIIVQISDLHNASFGRKNSRLINKIKQLSPDMIVITGDIVDGSHTDIERAIDFCNEAYSICPTYYVTGNHEYFLSSEDRDKLFSGINDSGVTVLKDETLDISVGGESVQLCGIDDESLYNDTLFKVAETFDSNTATILLAHEPQYFDDYIKAGPDLVLTGHAHGGQVRLPFVGGLVAPDQGFLPEYTEGEFVDGNTHMIISRGLGNSVIPVRVFDPPEIVCVHVTN